LLDSLLQEIKSFADLRMAALLQQQSSIDATSAGSWVNTKKKVPPSMRVLRRLSSVDDLAGRRFEQEIFSSLKQLPTDPAVNSGRLFEELEKRGILRSDPRLTPVTTILKNIFLERLDSVEGVEGCPTSNFDPESIENIKLDFSQFQKVIKPSIVLIDKAFKGRLVVPDFHSFKSDISDIFSRCESERGGLALKLGPRQNLESWGAAICTTDGQRFSLGDSDSPFVVDSVSKPFTYALCIDQLGLEVVQQFIGREPSGRGAGDIELDCNKQPHNPMVKSGALTSAALLLYLVHPSKSLSEKFESVHNFFTRLAGGLPIGFHNATFLSEREVADRERALAYFLREQGCLPPGRNGGQPDIAHIIDLYVQTCSLEVTCESLAVVAGTLANGGLCPITGDRVVSGEAVKSVLSLMHSCGMFHYSGQFAFQVGLPAMSGSSGVVMVVVPSVLGVVTWSPPLDSVGNSVRGVQFSQLLTEMYSFHIFDTVAGSLEEGKKYVAQQLEREEDKVRMVQLIMAASKGDIATLQRMHLQGRNLNVADLDNRTALHLAAAENQAACVNFLLNTCKVDAKAKDRHGRTALQEAERCNHKRIIDIFHKWESLENASMPKEEKTRFNLAEEMEQGPRDDSSKIR